MLENSAKVHMVALWMFVCSSDNAMIILNRVWMELLLELD